MTQTELAERLHVRQATVSDYENGKLQFDADELPNVADVLGVRVADLFEEPQGGTLLTMTRDELLALVTELAAQMRTRDSVPAPSSDHQPGATHVAETDDPASNDFCTRDRNASPKILALA